MPIGWLYATYHLSREPGNSIWSVGQFHHSSPPYASLHPGRGGQKNTHSPRYSSRSGSQSLGSVDLKQRMVPWHWREAAKCLIWLVVWNIFYFHPYLGKIPIFDEYFSDGLKPPTSDLWLILLMVQKSQTTNLGWGLAAHVNFMTYLPLSTGEYGYLSWPGCCCQEGSWGHSDSDRLIVTSEDQALTGSCKWSFEARNHSSLKTYQVTTTQNIPKVVFFFWHNKKHHYYTISLVHQQQRHLKMDGVGVLFFKIGVPFAYFQGVKTLQWSPPRWNWMVNSKATTPSKSNFARNKKHPAVGLTWSIEIPGLFK